MVLAEIRDLIRAEAQVEGDVTYQVLLDNMINQELLALTGKGRYRELQEESTYTISTNEQHEFTLPTDFQLLENLTYERDDDLYPIKTLSIGKEPRVSLNLRGTASYYYRRANKILVYPYQEIVIGDIFTLFYYKKHTLTDDDDELLVESLARPLILSCSARILRLKDTRGAMILKSDANQAFRDSRAQEFGT